MIRYVCKQTDELYHYGIKGQKWGVRRYQNPDGTYTAEGKQRRNWRTPYKDEDGTMYDAPNQKSRSLYKAAANLILDNNDMYYWSVGMTKKEKERVESFVNSRKNLEDFYKNEDDIWDIVGDQFGDELYELADQISR